MKWKHFPRYLPFVRGIHRSTVNSPQKGQGRRSLMFSLIYARINGWVSNYEAGDLRRHCVHFDVILMIANIMQTAFSNVFVKLNVVRRVICHWPLLRHPMKTFSTSLALCAGIHQCVTGPLCGEFTGHRGIPLTKANDAELWCFLWSASEQAVD